MDARSRLAEGGGNVVAEGDWQLVWAHILATLVQAVGFGPSRARWRASRGTALGYR